MKKETIYKFSLIAILVFAGFIYFYNLHQESLLTDEYFSFYNARRSLNELVFSHQKESNPNTLPPFYEIIMHFWLQLFGLSEFAQRSFSAILGIVSVYVLYRLTRLLFDTKAGLLAALFASLSFSWFSFFRQNRCYSLFICLTLLSFYLFFYQLKNKGARFHFPASIIVNVALIYTHYFAFLVILIELLLIVFEHKRDKQWIEKILLIYMCIFFAYAPWYANLLYDINREPLMHAKILYPGLRLQLYSILMILFSDFHIIWDPLLTIFYIPLIVMGFIALNKTKNNNPRHLLPYLILIFFLPFTIIYLITLSDRARYYAPFSFPLFILLAVGIQKINTQKLKMVVLFPMAVLIVTFNFADFYDFFHNPLHENWKQAVLYIKQVPNYQNEEMVFVFQTKHNPPVFAYYYWGNQIAASFIDNITTLEGYEKDLAAINTRHKVYFISEELHDDSFFKKLNLFSDHAWIWVFRYHDFLSPLYLRAKNDGKYFFHQITLNKEIPQIDFFLLKKIKK